MTEPVDQPIEDLGDNEAEGQLTSEEAAAEEVEVASDERSGAPGAGAEQSDEPEQPAEPEQPDTVAALTALVAERTEDLQRVQAEYVNYKKRVDRDRSLARQGGVEAVLRDLMPVFDAVFAAKAQDELTGGFKLTADELARVTKAYGFEAFGDVGDEFDPRLHEALMQMPVAGADSMTVHEVLQVGYRINDLVIRPARVIVAVPADE